MYYIWVRINYDIWLSYVLHPDFDYTFYMFVCMYADGSNETNRIKIKWR